MEKQTVIGVKVPWTLKVEAQKALLDEGGSLVGLLQPAVIAALEAYVASHAQAERMPGGDNPAATEQVLDA